MLEQLLNQLGLGEKEKAVYQLVLEHGKIAPALLARLAKINRTTAYSVANELKSKGLIVEDLGSRTIYYLPAREKELERIIEEEKEKAKNRESVFHELQKFLKNIPESKTYSVPRIRFVDEADLEDYLFETSPKWHKSLIASDPDCTWWGFQDHTFVEKFEKWIDRDWEISSPKMKLKLLTNQSDIEEKMKSKKYKDRRMMKFWGTNEFTATQWIVGSYIVLVITKQRPYYLVEIHDSVMAHNMREVFKRIWEKS